jgi:aspartate/methionine/tyrosine aminotransferase
MVYNGHEFVNITDIAQGRVPLIVMRGTSKDIPWPGGRCGWLEFHGVDLDPEYRNYAESVKKSVLMEVCSTTLPQMVLSRVYDHVDFPEWNEQYNRELEKNGNSIAEILAGTKGLRVNRTNGAFYMFPLFEKGVFNERQTLPIASEAARKYIEEQVNQPGFPLDKRFTYYLLASTGICVVPASAFYSPDYGFRLTTLDRDEVRRADTYKRLSKAVEEYLTSAV